MTTQRKSLHEGDIETLGNFKQAADVCASVKALLKKNKPVEIDADKFDLPFTAQLDENGDLV